MSTAGFESLDFERYHTETLPRLIADGRGAEAGRATRGVGSLAFRRSEGGAWTYVPVEDGIQVVRGDDSADTLIELSHESWEGIVHELEAAAGLLYGGRAKCRRGNAIRWLDWEPGLRALYNGRPCFDPAAPLTARDGAPLDPERAFTLADDREDMAHFLRTAGYLFVRNVLAPDEVERLLAEARELRGEARKGDKLSWWGKNARGEEVLCRVTRAGAKPGLAALPADPRLVALKDLADEPLAHRVRGGSEQGVTVIYKNPDMTRGPVRHPGSWQRESRLNGARSRPPIDKEELVPLEKLIRRPVQTLPPEATCTQAAVLMAEENIGAVVVADAGRPLGIVTDRDIAVRVVAQGQDPEQTQLRDVMSGDPVFLRRERGIDQAISSMRDLAVRRIPIVDEEGQLQGLIALDDLIILLSEQLGSLAQAIRKEAEPPT